MHSEFLNFIKQHDFSTLRVIDTSIPINEYTKIDMSIANGDLRKVNIASSKDLEAYINHFLEKENAQIAFGGYLETRGIYQRSSYFNQQTDLKDERNIHLGVDLWIKAGTSVHAAFEGKIHSFQNNTNFGDYGPTIILQHTFQNLTFYTLYGHLSLNSIENIYAGMAIKQGDKIAELGTSDVNGDYPPHLHFQVILDIENSVGDYPGVCSVNQLAFYKENCPDPTIILGLV
jgi:murein DD-endopeptidase MepM/ murein hydrolase activator NlpD